MSLLQRFLGGSQNKAFAEGMAFLKDGDFAAAVDRLRIATQGKADSPSGSLASFHFRQALLGHGRHLMRAKRFAEACGPLGEAAELWKSYPDLLCLHGAAQGFAGHWSKALAAARAALRLNPDYAEARLLEAAALVRLERPREAADSLNSLLESGRRVGHWLIDSLQASENYTERALPDNLEQLLLQGVSGRSEKEEVAEAVALCRSGHWAEGLEKFTGLVARRPRYPDYRTRLGAALFQVGRLDEALAEVDAALALNENYRAAIDLKGLILADSGQVLEARRWLAQADTGLPPARQSNLHEELFGAYLRAVLALLTGDPEVVGELLTGWPDLGRTFARAELLLAAADDLRGQPATCGRRLADLADEWVAEPLYFFLLAAHHLEHKRYRDVSAVLARWPAADRPDQRPLYLEGCLAVCEGRQPVLPDKPDVGAEPLEISDAAWDFLKIRAAYLDGRDQACWRGCRDLVQRGYGTERVLKLELAAGANLADNPEPGWQPSTVLPESCLPGAVVHALQQGDPALLPGLLQRYTEGHPELLVGHWLSPGFWLEPVRGWIA